MKNKMVRYTLETLPPMTDERLAELVASSNRPDSEIDLSDIPELTDEQYAAAPRYTWRDQTKTPVTIRLDTEVVDWFKAHAKDGRGYQTEINRVLRQYVTDTAA